MDTWREEAHTGGKKMELKNWWKESQRYGMHIAFRGKKMNQFTCLFFCVHCTSFDSLYIYGYTYVCSMLMLNCLQNFSMHSIQRNWTDRKINVLLSPWRKKKRPTTIFAKVTAFRLLCAYQHTSNSHHLTVSTTDSRRVLCICLVFLFCVFTLPLCVCAGIARWPSQTRI